MKHLGIGRRRFGAEVTSAARSRKYSAIDFIVENGSSNPSSVQLKVPYETVRILLALTMF